MPVVPYYCGRPARIWIAAMSGPEVAKAPAAAASAVTGTSPASARPVAPAPRPKAPGDTRAFAVTAPVASPWATWASNSAEIFRALHGESLLRGLPRDVFTERLTYYLGEVNAVHPFREGNGRAQRAFFGQLADDAGFILDWQHLDADRNITASAAIMRGEPALMRKMLDELIREP